MLVSTADHLFRLRQYMPDFSLVYGEITTDRAEMLRNRCGMLDSDPLKIDLQRALDDFISGKTPYVLSTCLWSEGISVDDLVYVVRAEGTSSPIAAEQIGGRGSRLHADKTTGRVIDFTDDFGMKLHRRSDIRVKNYEDIGWSVEVYDPCTEGP